MNSLIYKILKNLKDAFNKLSFWQKITFISSLVYGVMTISLVSLIGNNKVDKAINILFLILGVAIGWFVAFIISPSTDNEKDTFAKITTFISGYLLSKLDKPLNAYIESFTDKVKDKNFILILNDLPTVRFMGFIISFLITTVVVYVFRAKEYRNP